MFVERMIQKIAPGKWEALEVLDKQYDVLESKLGFPPKRRMRAIFGSLPLETVIVEREWESMAALEASAMKRMMDPGYPALEAKGVGIIESLVWEIYMVLP
jgi:hypothetical protein